MAELTYIEKSRIERFFGMQSGYVLNFSDRTFQDFIGEVTGKNIHESKYTIQGTSKANKLRTFIKIESNYDVSVLIEKLIEYAVGDKKPDEKSPNFDLYNACNHIVKRIREDGTVEQLAALQLKSDRKDFKLLAESIRESIERNQPEVALDRLHTFVLKFVRYLCDSHNILHYQNESLNAIFGKYVKYLIENKIVDSIMTERILKYSINLIESFNDIRNNKSLAHDNPLLNYNESILIFNNVTSSIKFIQTIEEKKEEAVNEEGTEGLPF